MELFDASLDNYELRILDISDTISASLVRHEFINTDGAYIDNLGNRPHEIRFKSFWFGSTYEVPISNAISPSVSVPANYNNHFDFLNEMTDSNKSHILNHPKYGIVEGYVETLNILHNDTQDYVEIEINFVEKDIKRGGLITNQGAIDTITTAKALEAMTLDAQSMISEITSMGHSGCLGKIIDKTVAMGKQFKNLSQSTKKFVDECDQVVGTMDTFLYDVTAPLTAFNTAINYAGDLPNRVIGSFVNAADRIMTLGQNLTNFPVQFVNNITLNLDNLYDTITGQNKTWFQSHFRSITAMHTSTVVGGLYALDEKKSSQRKSMESKKTFNAKGNRVYSVTSQQEMTVGDIEWLLFVLRKMIQDSIDFSRANNVGMDFQKLKNLANALVIYVDEIKLTKKNVRNITVNNIPLHLLCNQLGLSYQAAERVLALNPGIHNPTFSEGLIKVYVD